MAFSYSDENFTVIGNLCFVHIPLDGTETLFDIPPAISDRMLFDNIVFSYAHYAENKTGGGLTTPSSDFALIRFGKIICNGAGKGYLYCYFPIDSNK